MSVATQSQDAMQDAVKCMKEGLSGPNGWRKGRPVGWLTWSEIE